MSAISGPRGYEFQYIASIFLALKYFENGDQFSVYIEPKNGEDLELHFGNKIIEIQIKSEGTNISGDFLCNILCHFPAYKTSGFLFERLSLDTNRSFLLIAGGRCDADTLGLLYSQDDEKIERTPRKFLTSFKEAIVKGISNYQKGDSRKKSKQRHQYCYEFSQNHVDSKTEGILDRVFIIEKSTKKALITDCLVLLNNKFHISQGQTHAVLKELYALMLKGRDNGNDLAKDLYRIITKSQIDRPKPSKNYLARAQEKDAIAILLEKDMLLVKGQRLCGKTDFAKSIASTFYDKGFNYLRVSSFQEAIQFLNANIIEDRICLLEDPFGQQIEPDLKFRQVRDFEELIRNMPIGRKLIITCNQQVWQAILEIHRFDWLELTVADIAVSFEIWEHLHRTNPFPQKLFKVVSEYIGQTGDDTHLQPGHLNYLANNHINLTDYSREGIRHFAFIDAVSVSSMITDGKTRDTYITLAIAGDFIFGIADDELCYIISRPDTFPSIRNPESKSLGSRYGLVETDEEKHFPEYPKMLKNLGLIQKELDELESRGFIKYHINEYLFTHPIYFEAGKHLMKGLPRGAFETLLTNLKAAISVTSIRNATNAARLLKYLLKAYATSDDTSKKILLIAEFGLRSIFPAIRDICVLALMEGYDLLDEPQQEKLNNELYKGYTDTSRIFYYKGEPFYPKTRSVGRRELSKIYRYLSAEEFNKLCSQAIAQHSLSTEQAWEMLRYISHTSKRTPIDVDYRVLGRLLLYHTSFVRKMAAYHIMYQSPHPNEKLVEAIYQDEHPAILFYAVKGTIRGWYRFNDSFRQQALQFALQAFENPQVVISATAFMSQFGIGYYHEAFDWRDDIPKENAKGMWELWGKLMSLFFKKLPGNVHLHTARFTSTMNDSKKYLAIEDRLAIISSWSSWLALEYPILRRDDNLFYVTDYFFDIYEQIKNGASEFQEIFLNHKNLYFKCYNLRRYVSNWDLLKDSERLMLLKAAVSDETMMAVALTTSEVPEEIVKAILKGHRILQGAPKETIKMIPREILGNCFSLLYVTQSYFRHRSYTDKIWNLLLLEYLSQSDDPFCKIAINSLFYELGYRESDTYVGLYGKLDKGFKDLSKNQGTFEFFVKRLIQHMEFENNEFIEGFLKNIVNQCTPEQRKFLFAQFMINLELLEEEGHLTVIEGLFGKEFSRQIGEEFTIFETLDRFSTSDLFDPTIGRAFLETYGKNGKIRLKITYKFIANYLQGCQGDQSAELETVKEQRSVLLTRVREQSKVLEHFLDEELKGFILNI